MTRFIHRLAAFLVSSGLLLGMTPVSAFAFIPPFLDVQAGTTYHVAIETLQAKGVIEGYGDGRFKPQNTINRAEFLKIVLKSIGMDIAEAGGCFPDSSGQDWYSRYVCGAKANGIVTGYPDGLFHPERNISFVEAGKILALAYKVPLQQQGGEWYAPYALALESSKAIPPTVAKLDAPLTRGEMAEMMWRLSEDKTDQPSKAVINIQHPELSINMSNDAVQLARSCVDLQAFAQTASTPNSMHYRGGGPMMMQEKGMAGAPAPMAANQAADGAAATATSNSYSQTNVQVAGVDEADIVKTDGTYLYIVSNNDASKVRIVRADPASQMQQTAVIDLSEDAVRAAEIYVENGTLVVIGPRDVGSSGPVPYAQPNMKVRGGIVPEHFPGPYYTQKTAVRLYDVRDASQPKLLRALTFDGSEISSRRIGSTTYLVMQKGMSWPIPLRAADIVPQFEDSQTGKTEPVATCDRVSILPRVPSPQYLTVAAIRTDDASAEVKRTAILGNGENVYASLHNLYVATTDWNYAWSAASPSSTEQTRVYRFAFDGNGATFQTQGVVPGHVLNQYSMDENASAFRIATTGGQPWNENAQPSNNLYVLNLDLARVGGIEKIAPGETIYSARFLGDRAYLVTFAAVDPLFVVDLADARNPKILGQLKIPGYSKYLHPYDATHVIGFGKEVDASIDADKIHTPGAVYYTAIQGVKISLFDVSDVSNPREMYKTVIGDRGSESPVLENPKALLFEKDRNLMALPVLVTKRPAGSAPSADANPVFQGAYVYDVSLAKGFTLKGTITHNDDPSVFQKAGSEWYDQDKDVSRIVRINDSLLTISRGEVKRNAIGGLQEEGKVELK